MIKEAIAKLTRKENLTYEMAESVMDEIMSGTATAIQMSAYLTALSMKGETIEEITAAARGMRKHCLKLLDNENTLEIVGTGGDHAHTFNISTLAAIVVSAAGIPVAKHGNRAATSQCGSADVLEKLGVNIALSPEHATEILRSIGICFLFAQNYHLSMKYVAPVRRELGVRTIFNILGPLANPAGANMELLGVYEAGLVEPLAKVLANLGVKHAMVVFGQDGLDEISLSAPTSVCEVNGEWLKSYTITPEEFGLTRCQKADLVGGSPTDNAAVARTILDGEKNPKRDAVLLNAAAAIHIAKPEHSITDGLKIAAEIIDSGNAKKQLQRFVELSNS